MTRSSPAPADVVQQLRERGAVCFPGFVPPVTVGAVRSEAVALMARPSEGGKAEPNPGGGAVRIDPVLLSGSRLPAIAGLLRSDFFERIASGYDPRSHFCFDAVVTHDRVPCKLTDVHYDTRRSLSDVGRENAAFRYAYGTHRANREARSRFLLAGGKLADLPNVAAPSEPVELVDIEGPAGTLIVFDTDGFHSAGVLQPGRERLLIRSRTLLNSWFDHRVLRKAAELNPVRFFLRPHVPEGRKATGGTARAG